MSMTWQRRKRPRALASIAVLAALTAAGCGGGDGASGEDDQTNDSEEAGDDDAGDEGVDESAEPVTLSYAVWDANQEPIMNEIADAFSVENPNITIDVQLTPWADYWTKLQAAATGSAAPDVFWMNGPNFQLYASNGVVMPLSEEIEADGVDLSVYPEELVDLYTFDGAAYGLPKDFDTVGVWFNTELFDAAGVEYPSEGWTWADFQEAAAALSDPDAGVWGVGANLAGQEYFYNTIHQAGGYVISEDGTTSGYDDPATIEGLKFWTDLIDQGHSPDLATMTDTHPIQLFESGKIAMYWGGSWNVAEFTGNEYTADKVNVAPLPAGDEQATIIHGLANVVSASTEHPDEAWEFVKFLGSQEAAEILGRSGPIPAYEGTQEAWVDANPQLDLQVFLDALDYAVAYPISKNTAAWNEAEFTYLTEAWSGTADVESAAEELAAEMNALLASE